MRNDYISASLCTTNVLFHRKILGEKDLEQETLDAQKEELERQQRLMEQKKQALSSMAAATSKPTMVSSSAGTSTSVGTSSVKEQDSQLKSLLQCKFLLFL